MSDQPRQLPEQDFSGAAYIKDNRSPLRKLLGDGPVARNVIDFPGSGDRFGAGNRVALVAVAVGARMQAFTDAWTFLTKTCGNPSDFLFAGVGASMFDTESKIQLLFRSLRDPVDSSKPWSESAALLRETLESDEIDYLFDQLLEWDNERSNFAKMPTLAAAQEMFDALGKGTASRTSLKRYDASTLRFMLHALAVQHAKQTTTPSSDTGPLSGSAE